MVSHSKAFVVLAMAALCGAAAFVGSSETMIQWWSERVTAEKLAKIAIEALVLLPAALLIELAMAGWAESSINRLLFRRKASGNVDLLLFLIGELRLPRLLTAPFAFIGLAGVAVVGNGMLAQYLGLAPYTTISDPILGFVVCWLVRDFTFYWLHRALHGRLLWPLHRLHHSATEMTVICSSRSNFIADMGLNLLIVAPLSLFTLPADSIFACQLAVVFHGLVSHSNWNSDWGWFGRWVLVSPRHHRLHHGLRPEEYTTNMGTMLVWDHLFGTFRQPGSEPVAMGVQHPAYDSVIGSFGMLVPELVETARLALGQDADDPSVIRPIK